ncbi:putative oxidoreductase [Xylaria intraflava]|nr:putative oxidoreductase [Xylaria intraflava]
MTPQIVFGTAGLGMEGTAFQDAESVRSLLQTVRKLGISHLDTGARYPPLRPGFSEELLGQVKELSDDFVIDTKVFTDTRTDGSGDLTPDAISKSIDASLARLRRPQGVRVLYIHRADPATPLEEQIRGFNEQVQKGNCRAWGVSNVQPDVLEQILQLCERNNWQKPGYYQGTYNVISRGAETRLFPLLRAHGMKFVAFWALASGFLTGKLVNGQHAGTRLGEDNPLGKHFQKMYGSSDVLDATRKFDAETKSQGLSPLEVAIRWIFHHSLLTDDDSVLLGASSESQVLETVGFIRKGALPETVLPLVAELWESVKGSRGDVI